MTRGSTPRAGRLPDHTGSKTVLSREGRQAPAPAWPLPGIPSTREAQLWEAAWRRPQAVLWDRDGQEDLVGLYVRKAAEAELPGSSSATVETFRRLGDDLLLTVPAMKRAGVVIADAAPSTPVRPAAVVPISGGTVRPGGRTSARDRFRRIPMDVTPGFADTPATSDTEETPA
jgi:hypothetical protein